MGSVLVVAMHATYILLLLTIWSITKAANSFETLEVTDNPCEESHVCIPRESCSSYSESIAKLRILPRTEFLLEVRKLICNKEKRGICCNIAEDVEAEQLDKNLMEDNNEEKKTEEGDNRRKTRDLTWNWILLLYCQDLGLDCQQPLQNVARNAFGTREEVREEKSVAAWQLLDEDVALVSRICVHPGITLLV